MKKVFLFAGQGSQFYGMGAYLYRDEPLFRKYLDEADEAVQRIAGRSVRDVMMDETRRGLEPFDNLSVSSYAIYLFEYAAARALIDCGVKPDVTIGCSLGELAAQTVAGAMSMTEAISQIHEHEAIFYGIRSDGCSMLAVGSAENDIDLRAFPGSEIIFVSYDRQCVVSGPGESIRALKEWLNQRNIPYIELPVRFPFHTALMDPYREDYMRRMARLGLGKRKPVCDMVSCAFGRPVKEIDDDYRWRVLREKINWTECVRRVADRNTVFIDLSADGELAMSLRHLLKGNKNIFGISSQFSSRTDMRKTARDILEKEDVKLKAYVFPGQGSQVKGMGEELFDEFPEMTRKADEILGYSIRELCVNDPNGVLNNTRYTQAALFTVCALQYMKKIRDGEAKPDYVAGHSLGEYSALFAAGLLDFETGLRLVKKRGELMSQATGGGMAAVVGLSHEQVAEVLAKHHLDGIDIANLNTPTQNVISGRQEDIAAAEPFFTATDGCMMYKVLNVSGAFHSRYMSDARDEFTDVLNSAEFGEPEIPVIANVTARPYRKGEAADLLSRQLVSSVQWTDTIRYLMAKGVEDFEEIGPGHVVTGMVRQIRRMAQPLDLTEEEEIPPEEKPAPMTPTAQEQSGEISLGSAAFRETYHLKYSYAAGGLGRGISGAEMLGQAAKAGILSIAGTDGLTIREIASMITALKTGPRADAAQAFMLPYDEAENTETDRINLYLRENVTLLAVTGYSAITQELVRYRLKGLTRDQSGRVTEKNRLMAFVSRTDTAECFMSPAPERIIQVLLDRREITEEEAELARTVPMSGDLCVAADGGGYTDRTNLLAALPAIRALAGRMNEKFGYAERIRVGVSGGIGTGEAAAAAFLMGADFIVTGSVNQCTVESRTSDAVKNLLATLRVQDFGYISAGDPFDPGRMIQIVKKGTLFKTRAEKLLRLCQNGEKPETLDAGTRGQLENSYFGKPLAEVLMEKTSDTANRNDMRFLLEQYLRLTAIWAIEGDLEQVTNYQILCGPALGAFNEQVRGTAMEDWRNRTVAGIAEKIMTDAEETVRRFGAND